MKLTTILFAFLLAISAVFAAEMSVPQSILVEDIEMDSTITEIFTITNSGTETITNIVITTDFGGTVSPSTIATLAAGTSTNVTLTHVAEETESGNIAITSDQLSRNIPVTINLESQLKIKELEVRVGNQRDEVENGDKISDEASPGDLVEFKFELENLLEELDIEDIEIEITIEDIDEGDNLEIDSEEFDIKEDDDEKVTVDFTVPLRVDDKTFDVEIFIEGTDDDGNDHTILWNIELEVEKEKHEVVLQRVSVSPSALSCTTTATIDTRVVNLGRDEENNVLVTVENTELDYYEEREISLDEGSDDDAERTLAFSVKMDSDSRKGNYPFNIQVYRDGKFEDSDVVELEVRECSASAKTEPAKPKPVLVQDTQWDVPQEVKEESDNTLIILGSVVIVLGIIIALMWFL